MRARAHPLTLLLNGGLPASIPNVLGTVTLGAGKTSLAAAFPGGGTDTFASAKRRVAFRRGALDRVRASFERLEDGTLVLRSGERLADPAPEVETGESVCQGEC